MFEDLAWEMFRMTGDITEYLLYRNAEPMLESAEAAQDVREGDTIN